MSFYEVVFSIKHSASDVSKIVDKVCDVIQQGGGRVVNKESWGLLDTAYPIRGCNKAHYIMLSVECSGEVATKLQKVMSLNVDILRFLVLKIDKLPTEPSIMMRRERVK